MSTLDHPATARTSGLDEHVLRAFEAAADTIAPSWPLDRWIAVNPYWHLRDRDVLDASMQLAATSGVASTMPRSWFREQWLDGAFGRRHLEAALRATEHDDRDTTGALDLAALESALGVTTPRPRGLPLLTDLADRHGRLRGATPWRQVVIDQISLHLAAACDRGQAGFAATAADRADLYGAWRRRLAIEAASAARGDVQGFRACLAALPTDPLEVLATAARRLDLRGDDLTDYLTAALGTVRGWASWFAYQDWQQNLDGGAADRSALQQLLAIRIAWELLLLDHTALNARLTEWRLQFMSRQHERIDRRRQLRIDWLLHHAVELAYQERLSSGLRLGAQRLAGSDPLPTPRATAVFCIDVRSERFRRALEQVGGDDVATRGFAGFFGLPMALAATGSDAAPRPQLPGLLAPSITAEQSTGDPQHTASIGRRRADRLAARRERRRFRGSSTSTFTFVEALGTSWLPRLIDASVRGTTPARLAGDALRHEERHALAPHWPMAQDPAEFAQQVATVAGVLRASGLDRVTSPLVLLAGHGSSSANNPFAAALECGACGGQAGDSNARLLARTLNDPRMRRGLAEHGINLPAATHYVAALHDTTTDEVELFDLEVVPDSHRDELVELERWLDEAGARVRAERAPTLGLAHLRSRPRALRQALRRRGRDWAETRPEWGLADNAALIVAPRELTRQIDLGGRTFLHDYDAEADADGAILTQILTAPTVVANWINMQYWSSTVAPAQLGSGNKLLHDVVGGGIGVFEGNGGDLRTGLPIQSLHDGTEWRHTPRRLTVVVAATRQQLDAVLQQEDVPRQLVEGRWLHLLRVTPTGDFEQRQPDGSWRSFRDLLPEPPARQPAPLAAPTPRPEPVAAAAGPGESWRAVLPLVVVGAAVLLRNLWL